MALLRARVLELLELKNFTRWPKSRFRKLKRNLLHKSVSQLSSTENFLPMCQSSLLNSAAVPLLLDELTNCISKHLSLEGLFRIEARKSEVDCFETDLLGKKIQWKQDVNVRVACSYLKRWLRQLPEPVIPVCLQEFCVDLVETLQDDECNRDIELAVQLVSLLLPVERLSILCHLVKFLLTVVNEERNLMDAESLSRLFGPCLFGLERAVTSSDPVKTEASLKNFVKLLLKHHQSLGVSPIELRVVAATPQKQPRVSKAESLGLHSLRKLKLPKKTTIKRSKSMLDRSLNARHAKNSMTSSRMFLNSIVDAFQFTSKTDFRYVRNCDEPDDLEWKTLFDD